MSLEKSNIQFQNTRERTKIANSLKLHKQGCYCLSKHLFCVCNNHEGVNKKNQSLFFHSGDCWYSIHAVLQSFYRRSGKLCRSAREQALMRRRSRAGTQEEHAGQLWRAIWVRAYLQVLEDPVEEVDSSRLVGDPVEAGEGGDEGVGATLARAEGLRIVSRDQEK